MLRCATPLAPPTPRSRRRRVGLHCSSQFEALLLSYASLLQAQLAVTHDLNRSRDRTLRFNAANPTDGTNIPLRVAHVEHGVINVASSDLSLANGLIFGTEDAVSDLFLDN